MEIIGVDPGLVHTGVVLIRFLPHVREIEVSHEAVLGPNAAAVKAWLMTYAVNQKLPRIYIEGYRSRSNFGTDNRMIEAVSNMRTELKGEVLLNTGVKKVVRRPLMELLGVWKFSTPTNHDDLRSAARIGIYGALKDEETNELLYNVVNDHLKGRTWDVRLL